ncbi:MAG: hypothetical protein I3J02_06510 [Prevotella sp.]|nr:hypothetical protein [Prevotella sp.]
MKTLISCLFAGILAFTSIACSGEDDNTAVITGVEDGSYQGDRLNFVVDGDTQEGATVQVSIDYTENVATLTLGNVSFATGTQVWKATYDATHNVYTGSTIVANGKVYDYRVSFDNVYTNKTKCNITCTTRDGK